MSTLNVENIVATTISDGTSTIGITSTSLRGASAWCRFDSTGSGLILQAYNVTSLTDINTGRWEVTFTTPMVDNEYVALSNASSDTNTSTDTWINAYNLDATGCKFGIYNSSSTHVDRGIVSVAFFGSMS